MSEFVVVTGMSGAGRSTAAAALEDVGWFVIDNLPAGLIMKMVEMVDRPGSGIERVALVIGRGGANTGSEYFDDLPDDLDVLVITNPFGTVELARIGMDDERPVLDTATGADVGSVAFLKQLQRDARIQ